MPDCPSPLRNTWISQNLLDYKEEGTVKRVGELIDIAVAFRNKHKVPIFCGELGVFIPRSDPRDRVYWYEIVQEYFTEKKIPWTIWDFTGGFGLFEKGSNELFDYDLNMDLINALGFNPVVQKEFILRPDEKGFALYTDYIGSQILESGWADNGLINFYSTANPYEGEYCLYWTGADQYNRVGFTFKPIKDLSRLVNEGYVLDFWIRGKGSVPRFDIRFVDTKSSDPGDHPWRMRIVIDNTIVPWDGTWKNIRIPLGDFTEHGSWDNEWFEPVGAFDWTAVNSFEIVAEYGGFRDKEVWFDDIRVVVGGGGVSPHFSQ
jgi:endoglucanase